LQLETIGLVHDGDGDALVGLRDGDDHHVVSDVVGGRMRRAVKSAFDP